MLPARLSDACAARGPAGLRHNESIVPETLKELVRPFYLRYLYFPLRPGARPAEWLACWQYREAALPLPPAGRLPDILFLPMNDWHFRTQRPQQLALALARRGHRCFYVNPHLGRQFPRPVCLSRTPLYTAIAPNIWEIHAGLPAEPVFHHRRLSAEESENLARQLETAAADRGMRKFVMVSQFPLWNECAIQLRQRLGAPLLYDCHDLLEGFSNISPENVSDEMLLFQQADSVVFSAKSLLEKKVAEMPWLGEKARLVPNGVDVARFAMASGGGVSTRPVAGYAGAIDEWFDWQAVDAAAAANPDCDFVLLGRIDNKDALRLGERRNVRLYGEIPYTAVPEYMAQFRIGLIPFRVNALTMATNPIKLFEYFSCGLPVVSSALPEVASFGEVVYLSHSPAEFASQVKAALGEDSPESRRRRREIAQEASWDRRADDLLGSLSGSE